MNNKGFAVSGVLYVILLVFLSLMMMILLDLQNKKSLLDELKSDTVTALNGEMCDAFGISFDKYNTFDSSAKGENRSIAVITNTNITDYTISVDEPATKEEGMVWLKIDYNSNIKLSASNLVLPVYSLRQYINNKWEYKEAYLSNGVIWTKISNNKYVDYILNGTDPVLKDGLIPVNISDNGTVTKASLNDVWYDYENKKWANAVILIDDTSYNDGDVIPEEKIESYFVWVPRYRYRLWNTGTASKTKHSIEIQFEKKGNDTKDSVEGECTTPMESGATGNCINGDWMTHPAFKTLDVNGIWVGKFETGYKGATTPTAAQVTANDSSKIIVKPNVSSWRNNTVYNFFMSSYNYKRDLGSHMMKNTEWGAVAYLSHSKYGINTEVNINNNSSYKTGYSALPSKEQQTYPGTCGDGITFNNAYNTEIGYLASTTGNISGVYDMSGGAHEYVAAYMSGQVGSSGFNTTTMATAEYQKYLDVYSSSSTVDSYQYRILGDATGEMGPFKSYFDGDNNSRLHNSWYADSSYFVDSSYPWFSRGGLYDDGVLAGQFNFSGNSGGVNTGLGSRLVLAP